MKQKEYTSYELADIGPRALAIIIDSIILGVVTGALVGAGRGAGGGLSFIIGLGYYWYFWTRQNGQTPGKSVMKIRVIKKDGSPIKDADAVIRFVGYYVSAVFVGLGFFWAISDANHQGWHDKLANTYVVKANSEAPGVSS